MDKFVRKDKKREDIPIGENEVRVTAVGRLFNYVNYAATLYNEKGQKSLVLKGMGRAINKTVSLAEIIKRRVPGLHQVMEIGSVDITDIWEPKEEGLNELEITRHVSVITITLSSEPPADTNVPGYQPPLPDDEVKPLLDETSESAPTRRPRGRGRGRGRGRRGRGRGRGGDAPEGEGAERPEGAETAEDVRPRGRGRGGRGRGRRGRGRGRTPAANPSTATADPPSEAANGVTAKA